MTTYTPSRGHASLGIAALLFALGACQPPATDPPRCPDAGPTAGDAGSEDAALASGPIQVAVYDGSGIWAPGLSALVAALDVDGVEAVVLSADDVRAGALADHAAVLMAGGWAWDQWQGLGPAGISALRAFVLGGGGYLGICAGAYLASDDVVWEGEWVAYPLNLFDGLAEGPPEGLPLWPDADIVPVQRVDGSHPLQGSGAMQIYYQGGGRFLPRDPDSVHALLHYADDSLAALALHAGAGRVVLSGVHPEMHEAPEGASLEPSEVANLDWLRRAVRWIAGDDLTN